MLAPSAPLARIHTPTFHDRLRLAMAVRQVNNSEVARRTGASPGNVWGWVNGDAWPAGDKMVRLPEALEVSADWLFCGRGSMDWPAEGGFADGVDFALRQVEHALHAVRGKA